MSCRWPRFASTAIALSVLIPGAVRADVPDPSSSDYPHGILLVGLRDGVPDPIGTFEVVLRSYFGNPMVGWRVEIDFLGCSQDIRICSVQPDGGTVDCGDQGVRGVTDGAGRVTFTIVGGASNTTGGVPGHPARCVRVYTDGLGFVHMGVAAFDQNGSGGVNPADIAVWLVDSFDATHFERSDFNLDGDVNPADLSLLLKVSLGGNSTTSCSAYCH
jgi:hypothetical protein